jgi:hypothetical protein
VTADELAQGVIRAHLSEALASVGKAALVAFEAEYGNQFVQALAEASGALEHVRGMLE